MHIAVFIGTRPEAVKMAPVVHALRDTPGLSCTLVSTGQHKEMLERALADFGLVPDRDLAVMQPDQTLSSLSARLFTRIDQCLEDLKPDWVLVQGDTTTVMVAALVAFYRHIPVGHVEAGLRSGDLRRPFPEEANRRIAGLVTDLHFAPTTGARDHLLREGTPPETVLVTGNTVIDALLMTAEAIRNDPPAAAAEIRAFRARYPRYVLMTGHRRESFGDGFRNICEAVDELATRFPEVGFIYPVHLNPKVQEPVRATLGQHPNILLTAPQEYRHFIALMDGATLVLTDSGGVQEEAPSLGKPVLVMRDVTERPEGITAGCAELVGAMRDRIVDRVSRLLTDRAVYDRMAKAQNPYGNGTAGRQIADALAARLPAKTS